MCFKIKRLTDTLEPLRAGAPPISAEEREQIQLGWTQWRAEWVRRRKVFITYVEFSNELWISPPQILATGNRCTPASGRQDS